MKKNKTERIPREITVLIVLVLSQYTILATTDIYANQMCLPTIKCMEVYLEKAPSPSGGEFYKLKLNDQTKFRSIYVGLWVKGSPSMYQAFARETDDLGYRFLTLSYRAFRDPSNDRQFNTEGTSLNRKLNSRKGFWSYIVIRIIFKQLDEKMLIFDILRTANKQEWLGGNLHPFNSLSNPHENVLEQCLGLQDFLHGGIIPDDGSGNYFMPLTASIQCSYSPMTIVGVQKNSFGGDTINEFKSIVKMMIRGNKVQKMNIDVERQENTETIEYLKQLGLTYN